MSPAAAHHWPLHTLSCLLVGSSKNCHIVDPHCSLGVIECILPTIWSQWSVITTINFTEKD